MDEGPGLPANTREFMAMWNTVTADHLSLKLSGALQQLATRVPGAPRLDEAAAGALAPLLVRALQVAASPEGGVNAAVQFLNDFGADPAV